MKWILRLCYMAACFFVVVVLAKDCYVLPILFLWLSFCLFFSKIRSIRHSLMLNIYFLLPYRFYLLAVAVMDH